MTQQNYSILLSSGELSPSSLLSLLPTLDTQDLHSAIGALLTESHHNPTIVKALANYLEQIYIKISTTSSITSPTSQTNGDEHVHVQDSSQTPPPGTRVTTPVERSSDPIRRVEIALDALRRGEFIVVPDSAERENEADLIIAAEHATAEKLAFMINETSGLICVGVQGERLDELKLPQMVINNTESHGTAFTVSIDYKIGTTTGISAGDRAKTIKALTDRSVEPEHFSRPGHIFPLRAREGGVLVRPGHTEATVDFCRLAGCFPAGALCEIVNKDGSMTRPTHVKQFSERHNLASVSIADLIEYRRQKENKQ